MLCWYSDAYAALLHDEMISGDLPGLNEVLPVFEVGVGSNVILGELGGYPETADSFFIDLRNGFRLDAIIVTRFPAPENGFEIGFNLLYADSLRHLGIHDVHLGVDILPLLSALWGPGYSLPLENDIIGISLLQFTSRNAYGFDFVVSIESPVPLPSSLLLFLSGITGLLYGASMHSRSHS